MKNGVGPGPSGKARQPFAVHGWFVIRKKSAVRSPIQRGEVGKKRIFLGKRAPSQKRGQFRADIVDAFVLEESHFNEIAQAIALAKENNIKFKFSQIESTESFLLELDDSYVNNGQQDDLLIDKSAWLVITKLSLNKNEQELSHVLNDKLSDDGAKVLVLSKLGYSLGSSNLNILEVQLHKSQLENAYIYVGYSPEVNDGGLRYTIDVNSFYQNFLINNQDD